MKAPLSTTHPEIAAEWHPTKNDDLTPDQVVAGSNKKVWWRCPLGPDHEWEATLGRRTASGAATGCPFCSGRMVSITNSLASLFPDVAAQWHPTKNGDLTPDKVVSGSGKQVWWQCPNSQSHEWKAALYDRTKGSRGCPFCAGRKVSITNSLAALFPEIAAEWHPTKNGELTPDKLVAGSGAKVWWQCSKGSDHAWEATLDKRTAGGQGCPYCRGLEVSITNSLAALYPEIAAEWHPTKNGEVSHPIN